MDRASLAPYNILILDELSGPGSWGEITKLELEEQGCSTKHVLNTESALEEMEREYYDIVIIDLDLGERDDGIAFQNRLRSMGKTQPILFVTGNAGYLESPISQYTDSFAAGPVQFYDKTSDIDFLTLIQELTNRIDPIRRSLYIMKEAGYGGRRFSIGDRTFTVNELLVPTNDTNAFVRALRESLQQLILEITS